MTKDSQLQYQKKILCAKPLLITTIAVIMAGLSIPVLSVTTSSSDSSVLPATSTPAKIITIDSGITQQTSAFNTNHACPINFLPYVTLVSSKMATTVSSLLASQKICVNSVTQFGTGSSAYYSVSITAQVGYVTYVNSSKGKYVSNNDGLWDHWNTEDMPENDTVSSTPIVNSAGVSNIYWTLYCYPPSVTPPPTSCT